MLENIISKTWTVENTKIRFILHNESFRQDIIFNKKKPFHSHAFYEILFSRSDECQIVFNDKVLPFWEDSIIIIHPRYLHRAVAKSSEVLFSVGFTYYKEKNAKTECDLFGLLEKHLSTQAYIMFPPQKNFAESFFDLKTTYNNNKILPIETIFSIFLRILFELISLLEEGNIYNRLISSRFSGFQHISSIRTSEDIFQIIDNILNRKFTTPITAADISKEIYLSEKQINRYIFNQYSRTFNQHKTYLRIITACKMLRNPNFSISEISKEVGYTSINTFYSAFKHQTGLTPNEYRLKNLNETNDKLI